jgi:hypothetical protein
VLQAILGALLLLHKPAVLQRLLENHLHPGETEESAVPRWRQVAVSSAAINSCQQLLPSTPACQQLALTALHSSPVSVWCMAAQYSFALWAEPSPACSTAWRRWAWV